MSDAEVPDRPEMQPTDAVVTSEFPQASEKAEEHSEGLSVRNRSALVIVLAMVVLADICIYHANGYSGQAVFFVGAALLLAAGIPGRTFRPAVGLLAGMLMLLSWRLSVNGWTLQLFAALWLLHAFALTLRGRVPYMLETLVFAAQSIPGGYEFFRRVNVRARETILVPVDEGRSSRAFEVLLPTAAAIVFVSIFVMANPDVVSWVSLRAGRAIESLQDFIRQFTLMEIAFWWGIAWLTGGLIRPIVPSLAAAVRNMKSPATVAEESPMYQAYRNTLMTVIAVFTVYLMLEFSTLWFRRFPPGFYYAGYAHEGAAWLTAALALATLILSLIFRGRMLNDSRLARLKSLAWIWSVLNLVLAAAVYNRMHIYVDFNGMTRMRTIGLLGISSVVGGFLLVVIKIQRRHNFLWLLRRQLWVLGMVVYIYLVLPVDVLIHTYNVNRILAGDLPPIVQITGHAVDDEALPVLLPLCDSGDERIREGMRAMLASRLDKLTVMLDRNRKLGWTAWQRGEHEAHKTLTDHQSSLAIDTSETQRNIAFKRLQEYAYENWW